MTSVDCVVFRGERAEDTYLFLPARDDALDAVPEVLRGRLGELTEVLRLELTPERRLARTDGRTVLQALAEQGYYLQLPPPKESLAASLKPKE